MADGIPIERFGVVPPGLDLLVISDEKLAVLPLKQILANLDLAFFSHQNHSFFC